MTVYREGYSRSLTAARVLCSNEVCVDWCAALSGVHLGVHRSSLAWTCAMAVGCGIWVLSLHSGERQHQPRVRSVHWWAAAGVVELVQVVSVVWRVALLVLRGIL